MRGAAGAGVRRINLARFLLTRLMRGAADLGAVAEPTITISTHAPHARRGEYLQRQAARYDNFYSRASCEARLYTEFLKVSTV